MTPHAALKADQIDNLKAKNDLYSLKLSFRQHAAVKQPKKQTESKVESEMNNEDEFYSLVKNKVQFNQR